VNPRPSVLPSRCEIRDAGVSNGLPAAFLKRDSRTAQVSYIAVTVGWDLSCREDLDCDCEGTEKKKDGFKTPFSEAGSAKPANLAESENHHDQENR